MVYMNGSKMSKSLGNLVFVDQLRTEWDPRAIRLGIIEHHYRFEWEWDDELMARAAARLASWCSSADDPDDGLLAEVRDALDNDLDTPGAIGLIDEAARRGRGGIRAAASLLGVDLG
jgi:L-cysteine:1D-myo-inositol 2-amino-2-deoxy-alpha-D-glucopyranoside ligase